MEKKPVNSYYILGGILILFLIIITQNNGESSPASATNTPIISESSDEDELDLDGLVKIGAPSPEFELTTLEGGVINSEDLLGKVVVINFWASWCKPCEDEAPILQYAWEFYQPRGDVIFLGVTYADADKAAREYIAEYLITYANSHDLGSTVAQAFYVTGVPETYIIDQAGYIVHTQIGPFPSLQSIMDIIDPLLGE